MEGLFDEYVSLGWNCEGAYQIKRALGRDDSSFFSWNVTPIDALVSLIHGRMAGAYSSTAVGWDANWQLARESLYGFSFHGPWAAGDPHADSDFDAKLARHRAKAEHLAAKFFEPRGRRLYLYKPEWVDPTKTHKIELLAKLLANVSPDAVLVVVREAKHLPCAARHPILCERIIQRQAPVTDARDADLDSWDAIFAEFPHRDLIRTCLAA